MSPTISAPISSKSNHRRNRLNDAFLYVLLDCREDETSFRDMAQTLLDGGVDCIQLRDKNVTDRILLERAKLLQQLCADHPALFIVNDRPDIAVLAGADGVHVGQDELSVAAVRAIIGPEMVIGKSTHSIAQARDAVAEGADYIGVGPTFPTPTKQFDEFPGLPFLQEVVANAEKIALPAFAIGGITPGNVAEVLATGIRRVAVSSAITAADDPVAAIREIKAGMERSAITVNDSI